MNPQRLQLKAKYTDLTRQKKDEEKRLKELCEQMLMLAEYRAKDSLIELDTPLIKAIAEAMLGTQGVLLGLNSRIEKIEGALYG